MTHSTSRFDDAVPSPRRLGWALVTAVAVACTNAPPPRATPDPTGAADAFDAPALVGLSDADMVASAYIDGKLGPAAGTDALTVVRLDRGMPSSRSTLPVSQSVTGPPAPMVLTPDGRYAIVVETRGPRPPSGEDVGLAGLPMGRAITLVDLADLDQPRVVQRVEGPRMPKTVSISADGGLVAVTASAADDQSPLWFYRLANGQLAPGTPARIPGWSRGGELVDVAFSPSGRRLALLSSTARTVSLYEVDDAPAPQLTAWGAPVDVEKYPFAVRFSPDGHYLFANANYSDETVLRQAPFLFPKGTVMAIRLDAQRDAANGPIHLVTSRELTGRGAEALTVSPDGRFVLSIEFEGTFFPTGDPRRTRYSRLTLFRFDAAAGLLEHAAETPFDAILPESAVFDASGRRFAVASFQQADDAVAGGEISFWRIDDAASSGQVELKKLGGTVAMPRGLMMLAVPARR